MIVMPPSRTLWRRTVIVLAAGLLALAGIAPAIGGARTPDVRRSPSASAAADAAPWSSSPVAAAIRGADGLVPGGPGIRVPVETDVAPGLPVRTLAPDVLAGATLLLGTLGIAPDAERLPSTCPATAWRAAPDTGDTGGAPAVLVSLAADAPGTCQGFTANLPLVITRPARAGSTGSGSEIDRFTARTTVTITVAVLATPGISVRGEPDRVTVLPIAPTSGPVPGGYTVEIQDRDASWSTACSTADPVDCDLPQTGATAGRTYRVTAMLGGWSRSSAPVTFPAPAPN